ncbi:hypothetical protein J0895_05125 [Phormidium pseudopriestleyi FRX01]|uniref:Uncharacterized protein n=1 Tax=Phormidium pseudopriestleyi FRX01 TaxID=1759528 RepID=A0ABS3FNP9_9CYAN|nr:hypothetical protein [Phormidium pseudopriestleyi]MBO0348497.1 hypothetical protein [Phormidium pseudopriestleyi FRX01]
MKNTLLCSALLGLSAVFLAPSAQAQLLPQPWVSVGVQDSEPTFSVGVRGLGLGVELGLTNESAVGIDVMKFISPPLIGQISGYVGVGLYNDPNSGQDFAYSAGVQILPNGNFFFGAGYHNLRGINGQIGFKLY